jgi:hypothetical protein
VSVTTWIEGKAFCHRIVTDRKETYMLWHLRGLKHLYNGKAFCHRELTEQYKQALKELKKLKPNL